MRAHTWGHVASVLAESSLLPPTLTPDRCLRWSPVWPGPRQGLGCLGLRSPTERPPPHRHPPMLSRCLRWSPVWPGPRKSTCGCSLRRQRNWRRCVCAWGHLYGDSMLGEKRLMHCMGAWAHALDGRTAPCIGWAHRWETCGPAHLMGSRPGCEGTPSQLLTSLLCTPCSSLSHPFRPW